MSFCSFQPCWWQNKQQLLVKMSTGALHRANLKVFSGAKRPPTQESFFRMTAGPIRRLGFNWAWRYTGVNWHPFSAHPGLLHDWMETRPGSSPRLSEDPSVGTVWITIPSLGNVKQACVFCKKHFFFNYFKIRARPAIFLWCVWQNPFYSWSHHTDVSFDWDLDSDWVTFNSFRCRSFVHSKGNFHWNVEILFLGFFFFFFLKDIAWNQFLKTYFHGRKHQLEFEYWLEIISYAGQCWPSDGFSLKSIKTQTHPYKGAVWNDFEALLLLWLSFRHGSRIVISGATTPGLTGIIYIKQKREKSIWHAWLWHDHSLEGQTCLQHPAYYSNSGGVCNSRPPFGVSCHRNQNGCKCKTPDPVSQ